MPRQTIKILSEREVYRGVAEAGIPDRGTTEGIDLFSSVNVDISDFLERDVHHTGFVECRNQEVGVEPQIEVSKFLWEEVNKKQTEIWEKIWEELAKKQTEIIENLWKMSGFSSKTYTLRYCLDYSIGISGKIRFEEEELVVTASLVASRIDFGPIPESQDGILGLADTTAGGLDCDSLSHYQNCPIPPPAIGFTHEGTQQYCIFRSANGCLADRPFSNPLPLCRRKRRKCKNRLEKSNQLSENVSRPCVVPPPKFVESLLYYCQNLTNSLHLAQIPHRTPYQLLSTFCTTSNRKNMLKQLSDLACYSLSHEMNFAEGD